MEERGNIREIVILQNPERNLLGFALCETTPISGVGIRAVHPFGKHVCHVLSSDIIQIQGNLTCTVLLIDTARKLDHETS